MSFLVCWPLFSKAPSRALLFGLLLTLGYVIAMQNSLHVDLRTYVLCVLQEDTQTEDEKSIAWYLANRSKEKDSYLIQNCENRFFEYWESKQIDQLMLSQHNILSIPSVWWQAKRNIFDKAQTAEQEISFFLGFFAGKNNIVMDKEFRSELIDHFSYDRAKRELSFEHDAVPSLDFNIQRSGFVVEGRFPLLSGMPESRPGYVEKRVDDHIVWSKEIPTPKTTFALKGMWNPKPDLASVLFSTESLFVVFVNQVGIYIYEFDLPSGDHNNTYCFDYNRVSPHPK